MISKQAARWIDRFMALGTVLLVAVYGFIVFELIPSGQVTGVLVGSAVLIVVILAYSFLVSRRGEG